MSDTIPPTRPFARRAPLIALGLLAATAAISGCGKGTYLEIDFKGMGLQPIRQINLTLVDNSNMKYSAGVLPDGVDAASTEVVKFPVSVAFQLNDLPGGTPLSIKADAISPSNALVAHAQANTSVMHGKTWKTTLDFTSGVAVSLPLVAQTAAPSTSGDGSPDAGSPLVDDDSGEPSADRPVLELHFTP